MANSYMSISRAERRVFVDDFRIPSLVCIMLFIYVLLLAMHSYNLGLGFGVYMTFLLDRRQSRRSFNCQNQVFPS